MLFGKYGYLLCDYQLLLRDKQHIGFDNGKFHFILLEAHWIIIRFLRKKQCTHQHNGEDAFSSQLYNDNVIVVVVLVLCIANRCIQ